MSYRNLPLLITLLTTLSACSGSGSSDSSDTKKDGEDKAPSVVQVERVSLTGLAVKGVLSGATVTAYSVDKSKTFGSVSTGIDGSYSLSSLEVGKSPVLIELTTNENTQLACDSASGCQHQGQQYSFGQAYDYHDPEFVLTALLAGVNQNRNEKLMVTPVTHMAAQRAIDEDKLEADEIQAVNNATANLLGLTGIDINRTAPADLTNADAGQASQAAQKYGAISASFAELAANKSQTIQQVIDQVTESYTEQDGLVANSSSDSNIDLADIFSSAAEVTAAAEEKNNIDLSATQRDLEARENQAEQQTPDQVIESEPVVEIRNYQVTTATQGQGNVTPSAATVAEGGSQQFTIIPTENYVVDTVSGCDGTLTDDVQPAIYTTGKITANCEVKAEFRLISYQISATINNSGSVDAASKTVNHGATTTFNFTPAAGFNITEITGCSGTRNGNSYTIGVAAQDCTVSAKTAINQYTVLATIDDSGTVDAVSKTVNHGATTTFTFTPAVGFNITEITGCSGTQNGNSYTIGAATQDCIVSAKTTINQYTISATIDNSGTVDAASKTVNHGATTTFSFTPAAGFNITEITGCSGIRNGNSYTIGAATQDCTVSAKTAINQYTVLATIDNSGTVDAASKTVNHGATTTFSFTPAVGFNITEITGCSGTRNGNSYTIGAATQDCTVSAKTAINQYTVLATIDNSGSVDAASKNVNHGATTTFNFTPAAGFNITEITGCSGTRNGNSYTIGAATQDCTVSAKTAINQYTVLATIDNSGSVDTASKTVNHGATATFNFTPATGFNITEITGCSGTRNGNSYTIGAATQDCTVSAKTAINQYTISATIDNSGTVDAESKTVNHGATTTFNFTPAAGFNITEITGCSGTRDSNSYTIAAATQNCSVAATTAINRYTVSASIDNSGTVDPASKTVNHGATTTFSFTPATGFNITEITGCSGTRNGNSYTIGAATSDCTVIASSTLKELKFLAIAGSHGKVTEINDTPVTQRTVLFGNTTSFKIVPDAGYSIGTVTGTCQGSINQDTYQTAALESDCTLNITFTANPGTLTAEFLPYSTIRLSWPAVPDAANYKVYSQENSDGVFTRIQTIQQTSIEHFIPALFSDLIKHELRYKLESCDSQGICTEKSQLTLEPSQLSQLTTYLKSGANQADSGFGSVIATNQKIGGPSYPQQDWLLAIGAPNEDVTKDGITYTNAGAVYLFADTTPESAEFNFGQVARFTAATPQNNMEFGYSIAITRDGGRVHIGAPGANNNTGTVFNYVRQRIYKDGGQQYCLPISSDCKLISENWSQAAKYEIDFLPEVGQIRDEGDRFGASLQLYGNSGTGKVNPGNLPAQADPIYQGMPSALLIGAPFEDGNSTEFYQFDGSPGPMINNDKTDSGAVYLMSESIGDIDIYFKAENADAGDLFGSSIAFSEAVQQIINQEPTPSPTIYIGAPKEDSNGSSAADNSAQDAGAVYSFYGLQNSDSSALVNKGRYIKAFSSSGDQAGYAGEQFGFSLTSTSFSPVEVMLGIGAPFNKSGLTGINKTGTTWAQASDLPDSGAVYTFMYDAQGVEEKHQVKANSPKSGSLFGYALDNTGVHIAVGAPGESGSSSGPIADASIDGEANSGAVYVIELGVSGSDNIQHSYLKAANPQTGDELGKAVIFSDNQIHGIITGAPGEDSSASGLTATPAENIPLQQDNSSSNSGAVYMFIDPPQAPPPES